jgi:hypothetical protein
MEVETSILPYIPVGDYWWIRPVGAVDRRNSVNQREGVPGHIGHCFSCKWSGTISDFVGQVVSLIVLVTEVCKRMGSLSSSGTFFLFSCYYKTWSWPGFDWGPIIFKSCSEELRKLCHTFWVASKRQIFALSTLSLHLWKMGIRMPTL